MARHTQHFQRAIDDLNKMIYSLGTIVEESVGLAVKAVTSRDSKLGMKVIDSDDEIDNLEVDIEEECLKILALHQPVANDLRFVVAVLKINNDLERIGDLAVNIAERAVFLADQDRVEIPSGFSKMAVKSQWMLRKSLDALIGMDSNLAVKVCKADDEVDALNREMFRRFEENMKNNPDRLNTFMHLLSSSRYLERVADHATNIAEDVIYLVTGKIVRHQGKPAVEGEG